MSNAFAIAAVTAGLKVVLRNAIAGLDSSLGGPPTVTALPPDRVNPVATDPNQLNLFLYAVNPNPGWSSQQFPSRDADGERVGNPPLALDLQYLLTAYAALDYGAEILLGHGMQALHEVPFFTRDWIKNHLKNSIPPNDIPVALETSGLAEQIEQIRITPKALTMDEMSKIWTSVQGRYRTTVAYQVTVVLIESKAKKRSSLPVLIRNINVLPWTTLRLDQAVNAENETHPIVEGTVLRLRGSGLAQDGLEVQILGVDFTNKIKRRTETEIDVELPSPLPAGVRAGVVPVYVVRQVTNNMEFSSNAISILLRPKFTKDPVVSTGKITVEFSPTVTARQRVLLLLNTRKPAAGVKGKAFSLVSPANNQITGAMTENSKIDFTAAGVPAGNYVVRIQVDGAESLLTLTTDSSAQFDKPEVTLP